MVQIFGAITALIIGMFMGISYEIVAENNLMIGIAETAGMILFSFGIASVVFGNVH